MKKTGVIVLAVLLCTILPAVLYGIPAQASLTYVTVTANPLWTDTGLNVKSGDIVDITASGSWTWEVGIGPFGPDGQLGVTTSDCFYSGANHGELIAFVGPDPYQGHWGDSSFFPQSTGYWTIGSSGTFTSGKNGELWLGFNDDAVTKDIGNNSGQVTARIAMVPPPVGGYSISVKRYVTVGSLTPYLSLIAILAIGFTVIRRKTHRKTE